MDVEVDFYSHDSRQEESRDANQLVSALSVELYKAEVRLQRVIENLHAVAQRCLQTETIDGTENGVSASEELLYDAEYHGLLLLDLLYALRDRLILALALLTNRSKGEFVGEGGSLRRRDALRQLQAGRPDVADAFRDLETLLETNVFLRGVNTHEALIMLAFIVDGDPGKYWTLPPHSLSESSLRGAVRRFVAKMESQVAAMSGPLHVIWQAIREFRGTWLGSQQY